MARGIYRFSGYFGRSGSLSGIFTLESEQAEELQGKFVYFGEILGKHSEVQVDITPDNLKLITAYPAAVSMFDNLKLSTGTNPWTYWDEREREDGE